MAMHLLEDVHFTERKSRGMASLFVSYFDGNHAESMEALAANGLRPLMRSEALLRSSELFRKVGENWFWLAGRGLRKRGIRTFNQDGKLCELDGRESAEQRVRLYPGSLPLLFQILRDGNTERFGLDAAYPVAGRADITIGVRAYAAFAVQMRR